MKIISTNISRSKTIIYDGKELKTGIFKLPTSDEVSVGRVNIAGDEQADLINHGGEHKAVYAFASNHYDYWKARLDNQKLTYGIFGENFTVSNFFEESINIGDQFRFGSALLEVSQPRVPCFKLGIALKNKNAVKIFTQHYCTGVYLRVLESGGARSGDIVSVERKSTSNISIKKLFQAYFDKEYVGSESLFAKACALDQLAPEWKEKLTKRLNKIAKMPPNK